MSKFNFLWEYVVSSGQERLSLTFDEIASVAGLPLDHSFLRNKKELEAFGYRVEKVSMKAQTVLFVRLEGLK